MASITLHTKRASQRNNSVSPSSFHWKTFASIIFSPLLIKTRTLACFSDMVSKIGSIYYMMSREPRTKIITVSVNWKERWILAIHNFRQKSGEKNKTNNNRLTKSFEQFDSGFWNVYWRNASVLLQIYLSPGGTHLQLRAWYFTRC